MSSSARAHCWRLVADPPDLAVGDVPHGAVDVAEPGRAQGHGLAPRAARVADVDDVTDAVLVLDQHEDAGEEVLHEALGAEAERHARDAGAGDERAEVDAELRRGSSARRCSR